MQNKKITVRCPATVANLVCGFDVLGMCISDPFDIMELELTDDGKIFIQETSCYCLPTDPALNAAGAPLLEILSGLNTGIGFKIKITKNIKPGSGLGSSGASAAGAVVAADHLLGNIFSKAELVRFAMAGEEAACGARISDNVTAGIFGGVTLIRSNTPLDIVPIPSPELFVTVVHPQIEVKTSYAREILKKEVLLTDAVKQWGNVAGLVAGFMKNDTGLISRSLEDVIAEPLRSKLIPGFDEVKARCMGVGVLGGGISGSGPSVFMLSKDEATAKAAEEEMKNIYNKLSLPHYTYVTTINHKGVEIIKESI